MVLQREYSFYILIWLIDLYVSLPAYSSSALPDLIRVFLQCSTGVQLMALVPYLLTECCRLRVCLGYKVGGVLLVMCSFSWNY